MTVDAALPDVSLSRRVAEPKKPFYKNLWIQVLVAIAIGVALGVAAPDVARKMKPIGDSLSALERESIAKSLGTTYSNTMSSAAITRSGGFSR